MALFNISGVEGAVYEGAEALDPTCYRGSSGRGYAYLNDDAWHIDDDDAQSRSGGGSGGKRKSVARLEAAAVVAAILFAAVAVFLGLSKFCSTKPPAVTDERPGIQMS